MTAGFTNVFQASVAAGAELELRRAGLELVIGSTDDALEREPELAKAMVDRRVSALLMMPDSDDRAYLTSDHLFGTPVVLVGRPPLGLDVDVVMTDDDLAVQEATEQLVTLGHTRIAALVGRAGSFRSRQRLAGYRAGLARNGITPDPRLEITDLLTSHDARAATEHLMTSSRPPTGVLALNLGISTGVLLDRVTHSRDYAFIALDENELSAGLGITAIVRDPHEVGRQAAQLAIQRIHNPKAQPRTVAVPYTLTKRGSGELAASQRNTAP